MPAGPDDLVFPHSTVLEFLSAVRIGEILKGPDQEGEIETLLKNRTFDTLETLPFLCSESCEQGWNLLARLGKEDSIAKESLLPFRCLVATEAAEQDEIKIYRVLDQKNKVDLRPEKKWAYEHLRYWVIGPDGIDEAAQLLWLEKRLTDLNDAMAIPLCRSFFVDQYRQEWNHDDSPVPRAQGLLLERMLGITIGLSPAPLAPMADGFLAGHGITP